MLLRLVFHDAGTYAAASGNGGANGSLRFELDRPENRGLKVGCAGLQSICSRGIMHDFNTVHCMMSLNAVPCLQSF